MTSGGTIFFPVGEDDDVGVPFVEIHRVVSQENANADASTIINEVMNDVVVQAAIDGLRNPGRVSVAAFISNLRQARRARNETTRELRALHEATGLVEGRGD